MESGSTLATVGRAVDASTLTEALRRTAANHPDIVAVRTLDDSVCLTWSELLERVDAIAGGLAKLGVARGIAWRSCSPTAPSSTSSTSPR